ncbi:MAG: hypothetical protein ABL898_05645 [Hyphomicrobiaceae bacterium]|nr:hypothetical protein [Hyphomicrobiaceae bacterium]
MSDFVVPVSDDMMPAWRRLDADARARVHGLGPVLLLADHLDAALALAEDLTRMAVVMPKTAGVDAVSIEERNVMFARFAQEVRAFELAVASRVLQARKRAMGSEVQQPQIQLLIRSFIGGTAILADAVEADTAGQPAGLGSVRAGALVAGPEAMSFLCARGVLSFDVKTLDDVSRMAVTETFPIVGLIETGALMDMIAAFLDALDTAFDLYGLAPTMRGA